MLLKIFVSNIVAKDLCLANDICVNEYSTGWHTWPHLLLLSSNQRVHGATCEKGRKLIYRFLPLDRKKH